MHKQLNLLEIAEEAPRSLGENNTVLSGSRLDSATKATGRQGLAQARAALEAGRQAIAEAQARTQAPAPQLHPVHPGRPSTLLPRIPAAVELADSDAELPQAA